MSEKPSIAGPAGFNARVAPGAPKPATAAEGPFTPKQPTTEWKRTNTDYPDSTAPVLELPVASKIAAGVEAALNRHDATQARANGDDTFEQRRLLAEISRQVKAGAITNEHGRIWWDTCFPDVDPSAIGGQQ